MLNELKSHKVPVAVTSVGLIVAFIFGVVPLIDWDNEDEKIAAKTEIQSQSELATSATSNSVSSDSLEARVTALESRLNSRLNSIDLQLKNLNEAAGRLAGRLNKHSNGALDEDLAMLKTQARSFDGQLINLNKAVTRLHGRYITVSKDTAGVATLKTQARSFDGQLINLNKAVTRLHGRYINISENAEAQSKISAENAEFISNLKNTFSVNSN